MALETFRQGDVLFIRVDECPGGLVPVPRDRGRVILAYGEAAGHAHAVEGDVQFLAADLEEMEQRFLRVKADSTATVPVYEERGTGRFRTVTFGESEAEERGMLPAPPELVEVTERVQVGTERVRGAAVVHEEHGPVTLLPGVYEVRRAREYRPEAPVWVAD